MATTNVTERDRERARELCVAIFGDFLSEGGAEFLLICQALADARAPAMPHPAKERAPNPAMYETARHE